MEDQIPYGYCHCGCGEKTRLANQHNVKFGYTKGEPLKFLNGHNRREGLNYSWEDEVRSRDGYCQCGCGRKAPVSKQTNARARQVKGYPLRYITGHQWHKSPVDYVEEDRGYSTRCWIWQGASTTGGYGQTYKGMAHREYYRRKYGEIPANKQLHHLCEVRPCVNPAHLIPVTIREHARLGSRAAKLRAKTTAAWARRQDSLFD